MYFWLYPQRCIWKYKWPSGSDINWSYGSTPILLYKVKVMSDCSGVRIIMHSLPTSGQRVYCLAKGYIKETPWPKQQSFSSSTSMSEGECEFNKTHKKILRFDLEWRMNPKSTSLHRENSYPSLLILMSIVLLICSNHSQTKEFQQ